MRHRTTWLTLGAALLLAASFAAGAATADDDRGETLFGLCTQCHGPSGEGNPLALAPAIAGLDAWYVQSQLEKFRSGARGAHPDDLAGLRMRPMSRSLQSDEDVATVAAYVASLPKVQPESLLEGGDPERGKALYTPCGACHGADGSGNKLLNGPPLTHVSDWYLFTQLANFRSGVRGTNPLDQTGLLMRPMALILADEQAMKDVIAYIVSLGEKTEPGS
ncbi:MAG: cytochrome c [Proteobacteria bacterium]|nr:cytochrome c [Pseudomonadota bacterium]